MASRKPILLTVIGISTFLIVISALLPSAAQRRAEEKQRRLTVLKKVPPVPVPKTPAISTSWNFSYRQERGRDVTSHFYYRLGAKSVRTDLRYGISAPLGRVRTVVHLAFDPAKPDEVRLATAFGLAVRGIDPSGSLVYNVMNGQGFGNRTVRQQVAGVEKKAGRARVGQVRRGILVEVEDGSALAYPTETLLIEVEGRFYRQPKPKSATATVYSAPAPEGYDLVEALADRAVRLP